MEKKKVQIEKGIFIPTAAILLGVILFGFLFTNIFNSTNKRGVDRII